MLKNPPQKQANRVRKRDLGDVTAWPTTRLCFARDGALSACHPPSLLHILCTDHSLVCPAIRTGASAFDLI